MAKDWTNFLTVDDVRNSVEFKALLRAVKNEFPYVKDFIVKQDDLEKYKIVFFSLVIDPFMMRNYTGFEFKPWVITDIKKGLAQYHQYLSGIFHATYEDDKELRETIDAIAKQIHDSKVIPDHLKLPRDRQLYVSGYEIPAGLKLPDEYKVDDDKLWDLLMNIRNTN